MSVSKIIKINFGSTCQLPFLLLFNLSLSKVDGGWHRPADDNGWQRRRDGARRRARTMVEAAEFDG
jgi:hypothetical protein